MVNLKKQALNESYISRFVVGKPVAMYDIGVGPKTEYLTLHRIYPKMKIFGCEPDPQQFNELATVFPGKLLQVAIGEKEGFSTLHVPTNDRKCCSVYDIPYANEKISVDVITLDAFDAIAGKPDKILLWIDIEGAELSAFRSAPELFASKRIRWINLEERREGHLPGGGWCNPHDTHKFLSDNGYVRASAYNKHVTHQDVIYIHRDEVKKK